MTEAWPKINKWALELFRNRSAREFYRLKELITLEEVNTSAEHFSGRKKEESELAKANWSGVVNFYCMKMSLVMSMRFIFGDDWNEARLNADIKSVLVIHVYGA